MGSYSGLAHNLQADATLRVVDTGVTVSFTREEAHEIFERVLNSNAEDNAASAQALRKLAGAIAAASTDEA